MVWLAAFALVMFGAIILMLIKDIVIAIFFFIVLLLGLIETIYKKVTKHAS